MKIRSSRISCWILYASVTAFAPAAFADPDAVWLACDDSGAVKLDYANKQVTFNDRTYPMVVSDKNVTWQLVSDITKLTYSYTLDRYTGELDAYSPYAKPSAWVDHCKVGGQKF